MRRAAAALALAGACACAGGPGDEPDADPAAGAPIIAGCAVFPHDNAWNRDVSGDPVDPESAAYLAAMNGATRFLHPDFGSDPTLSFDYADESDPGPYPFPADAPVEAGGDRHVLVLEREACRLYETWDSHYVGPGWRCGSGAVFISGEANRLWDDGDLEQLKTVPAAAFEVVRLGEIRRD